MFQRILWCAQQIVYVKLHLVLQNSKVFCLYFGKYGVTHSLTELYTEGVIIQ